MDTLGQPDPMSQTEQRAQRLLRIESFYDGLDTVDAKLDETSRGQFQQMLAMSDNPQEARAQAVNKAYVAYTQPQAREAIESQWPTVRQQMAQQLGINKPEVSDGELYSAIGARVKEQQDERTLAHELTQQVSLAALEGDTDWTKAYAAFVDANKAPGKPLRNMDHFRQVAEAAAAQIGQQAHAIGPVVKTVSSLFADEKSSANLLRTDDKEQAANIAIDALMKLEPAQRSLAIQLGAAKAARENPQEKNAADKVGAQLGRSVQTMGQGLRNTLESVAASGTDVEGDLSERRQVLREINSAYDMVADPVKGKTLVTQGLLQLTGMLPQLGLVAAPVAGIPILFASAKDARQGELQAQGVPEQQASRVAAAQATIDTALNFVSSHMIFGKVPGLINAGAASSTGELLKRIATAGAAETAAVAGVTGAQLLGPLAVQEIASKLSEAVPGVDYAKELDAFKHAAPETIATILPMILIGTGAASFREIGKFKGYTEDLRTLQALGFSDEQSLKFAAIEDPAKRMDAIRADWDQRAAGTPEQTDAIAALDAEHEESISRAQNVETNPDGTYKVSNTDGSITLDGIADPAEAQRAADTLADQESDPAKALTALADAIKPLPEGEKPPLDTSAANMGIVAPGSTLVSGVAGKLMHRVREVGKEIAGLPAFTPFKQALNKWVGRGQIASLEIGKATRQINRAVPDVVAREGITAWLQANGDHATIAEWAKLSTDLRYKRGYEAALKLTPEQIKVAERLRDFYREMLITLQDNGLVDHGVENYVSQIWKKENPITNKDVDPVGPRLVTDLKHAKERTFGSYFEGEQLGYQPVTKDISKLMALYANSVSKVIATREFIKDLTTKKGSDGRPLAAPVGARVNTTASLTDPVMIKPLAKDSETMDYKTIENQPALTRWKWIGAQGEADVMLEGQLGLHPEIFIHVRNTLGRSMIRDWYKERSGPLMTTVKDVVQLVDRLGSVTKGTMLGFFSPFHVVQEATHAVGHKINPFFNLPDLDPSSPALRNAVEHGLMLAGDGDAMRHFKDSIDVNLTNHIPILGDLSRQFTEWMFHEYIPQLKLKTFEAIQERNGARYAGDLAAKKVTQGEIDYLSAQQTNSAYGHLNYADIGRNPTFQHLSQILLLAPDFLEARGRFAGQAFKGIASKAGAEQLTALFTLGMTQWLTARILNKIMDDDWHNDHPFSVVAGNRVYTMRSVAEDIFKLIEDPRRFTMGRISPLIGRGIFQLGTGKNWRGEKVDYTDTFKELASAWVPIALRSTPLGRELTFTDKANPISPLEQLWGSLGIHISRHSAIAKAYAMAADFKKTQGIKEDAGTYPVSKYQQLRYALEDGDAEKAAAEIKKLEANGAERVGKGFHASMFHPFTGSKELDQKFKASLKPEELALVEHAEHTRQTIFERYQIVAEKLSK